MGLISQPGVFISWEKGFIKVAIPQKENGYTAIANEIMEVLARMRIPGEARQMLDVIIRKTYGYGKKEDTISTTQFMKFTGLSQSSIHHTRRRLLLAKLITVSKNGNSKILTYSFQKDYDKWVVYPKTDSIQKRILGVSKNGTRGIQKRTQGITKDTYTKDNIQKMSGKPDLEAPVLYLNTKTQKHFDPKNKSNQDLVRARFNEGRTLEQFKQVVDRKVSQWLTDEKMAMYLRPSTLFNRTNFENYLNEVDPKPLSNIEKYAVKK